ncbi:MAG: HD domain-containing protein [Treponema sp.]|nr:HD domain-containing protein [Candidatus Treponema equifaecale]
MVTYFYAAAFIVTLLALFYMFLHDYKNIDIYHYSIVIVVLIVNFGFFIRTLTTSVGEAILINDFIYLDGTVLPALFIVSMMRAFNIVVPKWCKSLIFFLAFAHLVIVWIGCTNNMYYANPSIIVRNNVTVLLHEPGPWKIYHFIYLGLATFAIIGFCVYGLLHSEKISRLVLFSYVTIFFVSAIAYVMELVLSIQYEYMPALYAVEVWIVVYSYGYTKSHDVDGIVAMKYGGLGDRGYVAFDIRGRFLNANKKAVSILPELTKLQVDSVISASVSSENERICSIFTDSMEALRKGEQKTSYLKMDDITYKCEVSYFSMKANNKTDGFLFEFVDDTERQKYLEFMEHYNETLQQSIKEKSQHITEIQQKIVLGLSDIIENRDSNTGGHVRRTSDIVKILIKTLKELGTMNLDSVFVDDVIRAAPMHDLGKIAVDNSILCKPSRLTDEEFVVMKSHAPKSAEIVHSLLDGVEEEHFVNISANLARHHHERWDGKGYPEGLAGEAIPLEARIMAIADVYDALVSKRCYKESMSFDQAYSIIVENMGTQFDPSLQEAFERSRKDLEEYYTKLA